MSDKDGDRVDLGLVHPLYGLRGHVQETVHVLGRGGGRECGYLSIIHDGPSN